MTDEEIYNKIDMLHYEDDCGVYGVYMKGHCDLEQWKRVAADWLKTECEAECKEEYKEFKKGYFKAVPQPKGKAIWYFSEQPMRGATPAMKMEYL